MNLTSKQTDEQIQKLFGVSKKEALYNSSFTLMKMIGDMK